MCTGFLVFDKQKEVWYNLIPVKTDNYFERVDEGIGAELTLSGCSVGQENEEVVLQTTKAAGV